MGSLYINAILGVLGSRIYGITRRVNWVPSPSNMAYETIRITYRLVKAYQKIHKFSAVISYFSTQQWKFHNTNTKQLSKKMAPIDQNLFDFDISNLNWDDYFYTYIRGIRVYLVKDPLDTLDKGKKRNRLFKTAHYTIATFFTIVFLRLAWLILSYIF